MDSHFFSRLFAYDDWANREVINTLQAQPHSPHKAVRLIGHVVAVEYVWLARLEYQPDPAVWPDWTLEEVSRQRAALPNVLNTYLSSISPEALSNLVEYKNTKGEVYTNRVADILMHVVTHSAYHRGQVATVMRDSGLVPTYTDYIQGVRTKQVKE